MRSWHLVINLSILDAVNVKQQTVKLSTIMAGAWIGEEVNDRLQLLGRFGRNYWLTLIRIRATLNRRDTALLQTLYCRHAQSFVMASK